MTLPELYVTLLIAGTVLLASIAAARTAHRVGLPSLLLFLAVGIVAGEDGLGLRFDDVSSRRRSAPPPGRDPRGRRSDHPVGATSGGCGARRRPGHRGRVPVRPVTASGAHWLLGLDWNVALLLGAIVSSTDSAAVFSVLRALPLPRKLDRTGRGRVRLQRRAHDHPRAGLLHTTSDVPAIGPLLGSLLFQLASAARSVC
ncbi:hypothetical protein GCM10019016_083700 [Streptomyces prasinosporus]|uniref:Cation/H+ exchanger domain-containing protein n=1 Tax=Streptomyces prasinosporus TaxID=68256 RepID=A0ABP6U2V0_9ACTN